jgi:hypothetical protein
LNPLIKRDIPPSKGNVIQANKVKANCGLASSIPSYELEDCKYLSKVKVVTTQFHCGVEVFLSLADEGRGLRSSR